MLGLRCRQQLTARTRRRVDFEQELTEETEFSFPSPLSPFAPVELRSSSVRAWKNKAMHTVGQFHLVKVDE